MIASSVGALPTADTEERFAALSADESALHPGVDALWRRLGVRAIGPTRFPEGSVPVYGCGDLVLKLFPPVYLAEWRVEAQVLKAVDGSLPVPTPKVHEVGHHDGWGFVLMSRLPGEPLTAVWERTTPADRDHLATQLGEIIAALHRVRPPRVGEGWPEDWAAFVAGQRSRCVEQQRDLGLGPAWLEQYPAYLDAVRLREGSPVLLHTEIMRQHLLVTRTHAGTWRLSGLFDFEPAMVGPAEYEFASVGVFVSEGDGRFLRRVLTGYGYRERELDRELSQRLFVWALLHRYSNLAAWLARLPGPPSPALDSLAQRWFGTD
jgi:hygromycin-B 7''-O-kinase